LVHGAEARALVGVAEIPPASVLALLLRRWEATHPEGYFSRSEAITSRVSERATLPLSLGSHVNSSEHPTPPHVVGWGFLALGAGAMRHACADRPRPPSGPRELRAAILLPVAFEPLFEGRPVGVVFALKALSVGHGSAFEGHSVDQLLLSPASGLAQVSIA
jgi:hypothetical protein